MIVSGIATVHAPTIALSRPSGDGASAIYDGFERLHGVLAAAAPDLVIVFSAEHIINFQRRHVPSFCVGMGEAHGIVREFGLPADRTIPGAPSEARALVEYAYEQGFDVSHSSRLDLDHGTVIPLNYLLPEYDVPVLPVLFNTAFPPFPTLRRCHEFGAMIGQFVRLKLSDRRVAMVATGGIVHAVGEKPGPLDYSFDTRFLAALRGGDLEPIFELPQEQLDALGNGTNEIRCWLALAGALGDEFRSTIVTAEAGQGPAMGMYQLQWDRAA